MTTLKLRNEPKVQRIEVGNDRLDVYLEDGRILSVPLAWYPRLVHGTPEERERYELSGSGHGIHWPDLDEDIRVENLLEGRKSGENENSLRRWLARRQPLENQS
ncbi:MAG: DUF2442 domain-containing protein [Gemmatimonadota bacterium]